MRIIDTSRDWHRAFAPDARSFDLERWEAYMDSALPEVKPLCLADMREMVDAGCSWERDFFPVLCAVSQRPAAVEEAVLSFHRTAEELEERTLSLFGRTVQADLILYLGLCNGAGWVTSVGSRTAILLGIEKILELGWTDMTAMRGLILHEAGHVYQSQYGVLERELPDPEDRFLWQLFTEGVAMSFEQRIMGSDEFFHQDAEGWKDWCDSHIRLLAESFREDLPGMTAANQRYFGDWVRFRGYGDTGYYLGARLVQFMLRQDAFDTVIRYGMEEVRAAFGAFTASLA